MGRRNYKGDVGIGTLIVFIAMVLVAAVAAAVLLNVSGMLQQRASSTGKETTKQVSSNLQILSVVGEATTTNVDNMTITLKAAAGSGRIDLSNMLIKIDNTSVEQKLTYSAGTAATAGSSFGIKSRVDPNGIFSASTPIIDPNALVDINISSGTSQIALSTRTSVHIELLPELGAPVILDIKTPDVYAGKVVNLYP